MDFTVHSMAIANKRFARLFNATQPNFFLIFSNYLAPFSSMIQIEMS
jgi:hypothetical protein